MFRTLLCRIRSSSSTAIRCPTFRRSFSLEAPKPASDPVHFPDSFLGLQEQYVEIDKEVFQQYHCYPTLADVRFIKHMTAVLKGGAITFWEAAGILKRFNIQLRSFHICEILKKNIDCDASMGLFRWAESQPGFQHDSNSYNIMLRVVGYNHNFRDLQALVKEMKAKNIQATYVTFMTVVQSYFDAVMVDKALQTFLEFERYVKRKPKKKYYQYVVKKLIECKRTDWIPTVVNGMLEVGYVTDTETFNVVIQGLCSSGKLDPALDLSRKMIEKGCVPDVHTYIYLITGLVTSGSMERAEDIIQDMKAKGCKPNVHNFDLLLEFLLGSEKAVEALDVVKRMLIEGCGELHSSSNRILMKFFEEREKDEDDDPGSAAALACGFYEELSRHDVFPDLMTYNGLLRLLNGAGRDEEAMKLHQGMKMRCVPDIETQNILLQILCSKGKTEEAMEVLRGLKKLRLRPNKVTFDVVLVGLAMNDRLAECLKVMKKMEKMEFAPEEATYACVIEALSIGGLHDQALRLFGRMKLEGLSLSVELQNDILRRRRRFLEDAASTVSASAGSTTSKGNPHRAESKFHQHRFEGHDILDFCGQA